MKKFILSMLVMVSFGFYVIWQSVGNFSNNFTAPTVATAVTVSSDPKQSSNPNPNPKLVAVIPTAPPVVIKKSPPVTPVVNNPAPVVNNPPPVVTPPKPAGMYRDGTYTGNSAEAFYGYVQVQAVIYNGQLYDVVFLDYPQDRGHSIQINNYALPILRSEAIAAQNANVNVVSGATDSSGAFVQSLTSALTQAVA